MSQKIKLPLTDEAIRGLHAGDNVLLSGVIYVARDAAHKRMVASMANSEPLSFDLRGQTIYYMGPSPARPEQVIGAAGPTTSGRMDSYAPTLIKAGAVEDVYQQLPSRRKDDLSGSTSIWRRDAGYHPDADRWCRPT